MGTRMGTRTGATGAWLCAAWATFAGGPGGGRKRAGAPGAGPVRGRPSGHPAGRSQRRSSRWCYPPVDLHVPPSERAPAGEPRLRAPLTHRLAPARSSDRWPAARLPVPHRPWPPPAERRTALRQPACRCFRAAWPTRRPPTRCFHTGPPPPEGARVAGIVMTLRPTRPGPPAGSPDFRPAHPPSFSAPLVPRG